MALTENVKNWGKRTTEAIQAAYYSHHSKKMAFQALGQIEKDKGKLAKTLKKTAYEYAIEVLGGKVYAPWLYVYTAIAGDFREGWIPDNYYHLITIPKIQGDYGKISFLKPLNQKIFKASLSPDIAFFIHGVWYDKDFMKIGKETLAAISFAENERVVFKADQSYQGRGIFIKNRANFEVDELENKGNGTLQRYIEQHRFFTDFHSGSVANIRLTTVIDPGGNADLRAAYLRLGRAADTHVKSDTHIRIPIDLNSGALHATGYSPDWRTMEQHPDSLIAFSDKTVPGYQESIRSALSFHQSFPMVRAIGWDFAVDKENRPTLMEWNGYGNDIKFSEATQGPCFKDLGWDKLKAR